MLAHEFRLPGGDLGGSGRPDPKYILYKGVALKLTKRNPEIE